MIYGIRDKIPFGKLLIYALQQLLAIFVATVLIANICGTPVDACLIGAGIGTLVYQCITRFRSPMFISSCGATVSAVLGALALGECGQNYLAVAIGGAVILIVYGVFAIIIKCFGPKSINKIFPPTIIGSVTMLIGLNLAKFIPTYVSIAGVKPYVGVLIALFTMIVIAVSSHYIKGFFRTIPFLIGLAAGYLLCMILTLTKVAPIIDFSYFKEINSVFSAPDFSFLHWKNNTITGGNIIDILLLFIPVSICAVLEHYSDHKCLSNIIDVDLTENPGLDKTLLGDGVASAVGTVICGLPNTSYGESVATTGFSKVGSVWVITTTAVMLILLSFITPFQAFLKTIPSCVFGGCAMILYGYIAASGLKTLINNKVDLENNKNLIVVSVILTIGVSGIVLFSDNFSGVSLAMVVGVILNLILHDKKPKTSAVVPDYEVQKIKTNSSSDPFPFEQSDLDRN